MKTAVLVAEGSSLLAAKNRLLEIKENMLERKLLGMYNRG